MKRLLIGAIGFYRRNISPAFPPSCRFVPTCSEYALESIRLHGAAKGGFLALRRLLRCNPLGSSGYDPVPPVKTRTDN